MLNLRNLLNYLLIATIIISAFLMIPKKKVEAMSIKIDGVEALINGGFESGLNEWDCLGGVSIGTSAYSGTYAAEFDGSIGMIMSQNITVPAITASILFSSWYKLEHGGKLEFFVIDDSGIYTQLLYFSDVEDIWQLFSSDLTPLMTGASSFNIGCFAMNASIDDDQNTVPEPCTMILVVAGLGIIGVLRRRYDN